jgi:valyl-tRNA synthetase
MSWKVDNTIDQPDSSKVAVKWMDEKMKRAISEIDANFRKFRISQALMITYKLFWDEFSGWYLEIIKPEYQKHIDSVTYNATISFFEKLMKVMHPFMPFITEEIWQQLLVRKDGESIMVSGMPEAKKFNKELISRFETVKEIIGSLRSLRKDKNIPNKEKVDLLIRSDKESFDNELLPVISKLCNLSGLIFVSEKQEGAASFLVDTTEYYVPLNGKLNVEDELAKIKDELDYTRGFLANVMRKLENERFVKNAPASVLELEQKKKSDAESKINSLEEAIKSLNRPAAR